MKLTQESPGFFFIQVIYFTILRHLSECVKFAGSIATSVAYLKSSRPHVRKNYKCLPETTRFIACKTGRNIRYSYEMRETLNKKTKNRDNFGSKGIIVAYLNEKKGIPMCVYVNIHELGKPEKYWPKLKTSHSNY
jgi:hypothetical protein